MSQNNTGNSAAWIRETQWNSILQENFNDENFMIGKYVDLLPDVEGLSTEIKIPGVGTTEIADYVEGADIQTTAVGTKMFTFTPDQEQAGGISVTDKMERDSYYMPQVLSYVPEDQTRVCYENFEKYFFELSKALPVNIDGTKHRIQGGDAGKLALTDFIEAKRVIRKSAKLHNSHVAFISGDQAAEIEKSIGITAPANARWEPVAEQGLMDSTGMSFLLNAYGVDVYVTSFLSLGQDYTGTGGVDSSAMECVIVFSATARKSPFIGAWVERPHYTHERFEKKKTTEYYVHMAFGGALIYPQNLVVIECLPTV